MHTTQTICKLHASNAREEVFKSSQFKLQKVKVKTDELSESVAALTAHILTEETKDILGSFG